MKRSLSLEKGFTIIEVILFLAISGLMMVGLLAVVGSGINNQRYTEAVDSFQDFLLTQYSAADNVANNSDSASSTCAGDDAMARGASSCSVIGRLITSDDGVNINATPLYASTDVVSIDQENIDSTNDLLDSLNLYAVADDVDSDSFSMRWETNIQSSDGGDASSFTIAVVRLPYGGGSMTFAVNGATSVGSAESLAEFIDRATSGGSADEALNLCVDPQGLQMSSPVGLVIHNSASSGTGAIERQGDICQ